MDRKEKFASDINNGYACEGDNIVLGGAMLDGQPVAGCASEDSIENNQQAWI